MFANQGSRNKKLSKSSLSPGTKQTIQNVSGRRLKTEKFADDRRIKKDLGEFEKEYSKVYAANQSIKRILLDNGLKEEGELVEKTMRMLSHQFHKSKYPQNYDGDKQAK